jgi:hypothetical protein
MQQWDLLAELDTSQEKVLAQLFKSNPERAWDCIAEVFLEGDCSSSFGIQRWLGDSGHPLPGDEAAGVIQFVPSGKLFAWVDEDVEKRGRWLVNALPRTLARTPAGRLTRDFIVRYDKVEFLCGSLCCHFYNRGWWWGPPSAYYRKLREEAREWLVDEKNRSVIRWIEKYIDELDDDIRRAEIAEERRL